MLRWTPGRDDWEPGADTWSPLPDLPEVVDSMRLDERPGTVLTAEAMGGDGERPYVGVFHLRGGAWVPVEPPDPGRDAVGWSGGVLTAGAQDPDWPAYLAEDPMVLTADGWEQAPGRWPIRSGDTLFSLAPAGADEGTPPRLAVRVGPGEWQQITVPAVRAAPPGAAGFHLPVGDGELLVLGWDDGSGSPVTASLVTPTG